MIEPLKVGLYILLLIPGFIFVQTKEYHLLREKIPQFEKTFNIILWSAIIWFLAFYSPYLPFADDNKKEILLLINKSCSESKIPELPTRLLELKISLTNFFIIVCLWAFIIANTIGIVRKSRYIDGLLKWVTGRDWYPSVAFRFFKENMNKVIEVKTSEHRYLGILYCAPDKVDDKYIIVTEPYIIHDKKRKKFFEKLTVVDYIIFDIDKIEEIKAYNEIIKKNKSLNIFQRLRLKVVEKILKALNKLRGI